MKPTAILEMVKAKPFRPFIVHMSGGSQCAVLRPDMAIVSNSVVYVGTPAETGPPGLAERISILSLDHIQRITLIDEDRGNH